MRDLVLALGPPVSLLGNGGCRCSSPPGNNCCGPPASLVPAWGRGGAHGALPAPLTGLASPAPGSQGPAGTGSGRSQHRGPCVGGSPALVWPPSVTESGFDFLSPSKSDLPPPSTPQLPLPSNGVQSLGQGRGGGPELVDHAVGRVHAQAGLLLQHLVAEFWDPVLPPPSSNQRKDMMLQVCALASCQVTRLGLRDGAVRTGSTGHAESVSCLLPTLLWRVDDLPHSGA